MSLRVSPPEKKSSFAHCWNLGWIPKLDRHAASVPPSKGVVKKRLIDSARLNPRSYNYPRFNTSRLLLSRSWQSCWRFCNALALRRHRRFWTTDVFPRNGLVVATRRVSIFVAFTLDDAPAWRCSPGRVSVLPLCANLRNARRNSNRENSKMFSLLHLIIHLRQVNHIAFFQMCTYYFISGETCVYEIIMRALKVYLPRLSSWSASYRSYNYLITPYLRNIVSELSIETTIPLNPPHFQLPSPITR